MSGGKSNKKNIVSIIIIVALLIGACFATISVDAKKTLNKPRFKMPEEEPVASAVELPQDKSALCAYVNSLYEDALKADNAEGSWHTDVNLDGEITTPFSQADQAIVSFIKDNAAGQIAALYPNESEVKMSETDDAPVIRVNEADVTGFTAERGHTDDEGNVSDDGFYFVTFTLDPVKADTKSLAESEVYAETAKMLSPVAELKEAEFEPERYEISYKIDRVSNQIVSVDVSNDYKVKASAVLVSEAAGLLPEEQNSLFANVELPYRKALRVGFSWYGARFTQRSIVLHPSDMKALPADVRVNSAATKEDYKLTFTPSDKEILSVDEDGVVSVSKTAIGQLASPDDTLSIKMKLEYGGHAYEDELKVYITDLETEVENG
jgi:hypothetical protein